MHRWSGNVPPQLFLHNNELLDQDVAFLLLFFVGLRMIDKQSNHIKQAGEPTNHKNYMQRFYRVNTHASKVII